MIHILDEITLAPERISEVTALLHELYLPDHQSRGLSLVSRWVSPPVAVPGERNVLWLLWQVKDAPTYYQMRAMTTASVVEFWARIDAICEARQRHVMVDADTTLPTPLEPEHAA